MHGNGERVGPGSKGAEDRKAVDNDVVFNAHSSYRMEEVGLVAGLDVVSEDFLAVEVNDDSIVALAAEFQVGVLCVGGKRVTEVSGVTVRFVFRPSDVDAVEHIAVTEPAEEAALVPARCPFGVVERVGRGNAL